MGYSFPQRKTVSLPAVSRSLCVCPRCLRIHSIRLSTNRLISESGSCIGAEIRSVPSSGRILRYIFRIGFLVTCACLPQICTFFTVSLRPPISLLRPVNIIINSAVKQPFNLSVIPDLLPQNPHQLRKGRLQRHIICLEECHSLLCL